MSGNTFLIDLADVLALKRVKSYGTIGEAFESWLFDALAMFEESGSEVPESLREACDKP
jgi:hypothetical protein